MQAYFKAEQQLSLISEQMEEQDQYFSKLRETSDKLKSYEDSLQKIDSAFPSDPNVSVPPLIVYMLKITAESGVTVKNVDIGTTATENKETGLSEIKFNLTGSSASYAVFKNLIKEIYNSARMIDIDSVSMSAPALQKTESVKKTTQPQAEEEYQFSMSLRTNFYAEKSSQSPSFENQKSQ